MKMYFLILCFLAPLNLKAETNWRLEIKNSSPKIEVTFTVRELMAEVALLLMSIAQPLRSVDGFSGVFEPDMKIDEYLFRFQRFSDDLNPHELSPGEIFSALIYLKNLVKSQHLVITTYNVHRLIFISLHTAVKVLNDTHKDNQFYASVAGTSLSQFNQLESRFLNDLGWNVNISSDEFELLLAHFALARSDQTTTYLQEGKLVVGLSSFTRQDSNYTPIPKGSLNFFRDSLLLTKWSEF